MRNTILIFMLCCTSLLWAQITPPPGNTTCAGGPCLPLAGGTMTGALNGTSSNFSGTVAAGTAVTAPNLLNTGLGYTFYLSSGTYYARNNATNSIDYSGTDAGVVINAAIANNASVCGHLNFAPAVYNINSLIQSTSTLYYAIGLPAQVSSGQYCKWTVEGVDRQGILDQFATAVQTSGAIFYITPTAVASVAGTPQIDGIYVLGVGPDVSLRNFDMRFPTNQRGSETAVDVTAAICREL